MKKYLVLLVLPAMLGLQFCSSGKKAQAPPPPTVAKINFNDQVKPLVSEKCAPCHTTGNKSHLINFSESKEHADDMIRRVSLAPGEKGFMPFKHDKLSDSLINVLVQWKNDGLLESAQP